MNEKSLVLGLGNTLLTDSGVGVYIVRRLKNVVQAKEIAFKESDSAGLNLIALMDGFDRVIIIDAIKTHTGVPGNVYRFCFDNHDDANRFPNSAHIDMDILRDRVKIGNVYMPSKVVIYAVEAEDFSSFGKGCTSEVEKVIPRVMNLIMEEMNAKLTAD